MRENIVIKKRFPRPGIATENKFKLTRLKFQMFRYKFFCFVLFFMLFLYKGEQNLLLENMMEWMRQSYGVINRKLNTETRWWNFIYFLFSNFLHAFFPALLNRSLSLEMIDSNWEWFFLGLLRLRFMSAHNSFPFGNWIYDLAPIECFFFFFLPRQSETLTWACMRMEKRRLAVKCTKFLLPKNTFHLRQTHLYVRAGGKEVARWMFVQTF